MTTDTLLELEPATFHERFGHKPFRVRHLLGDHPLFAPPRLLRLATTLPEDRVEYNSGELPVGVDPALTPRTGLSIEETVRRIEECKSWMVLKDGVHVPVTAPHWVKNGPQVSVSFSITFQTRLSERRGIIYRVNHALRQRGWSPTPVGSSRWRDGLKYFGYRVVRRLRRAAGRRES
jgi:hypothetical protein